MQFNDCLLLELLEERPLLRLHHPLQAEVRQALAEVVLLPSQNREIRLDSASAREYGGQNATELHQVRKSGSDETPTIPE